MEFSHWLHPALLTCLRPVCRIEARNTEQLKGGELEWIKF
jgi:hypothetical protein